MTTIRRHLRVVVVSPNDVATERDVVVNVIEDLNSGIADALGYHLDCYRWETDVYPRFHSLGPQGAIDQDLGIQQSDIVIGIFWKRFGTPVSDANSGTEHELRLALAESQRTQRHLPVVMLYFKTEAFSPRTVDDIEQMKRVLEFKSSIAQQAVYGDIDDADTFPQRLQNNLTQLLRANLDLSQGVERTVVPSKTVGMADWRELRLDQTALYTFCGLARETQSGDIFQDFRVDPHRFTNPNPVSHLWADVYRGCAITAAVEEADPPHLSVTFENQPSSWPCNITIRPAREQALRTGGKSAIVFEARVVAAASSGGVLDEVAIAVRVINGWCQHWAHGPSGRHRLTSACSDWQVFTIPFKTDEWWLFPSDGNHLFGPSAPDFEIIAGLVLEFGSHDIHRAGPGRGTVQIRNVHLA